LDIGAILDLEIGLDDGPLTAKVRVADAWVDGETTGASRPECLAGLEFLGLPAQEAARLRRVRGGGRRGGGGRAAPRPALGARVPPLSSRRAGCGPCWTRSPSTGDRSCSGTTPTSPPPWPAVWSGER